MWILLACAFAQANDAPPVLRVNVDGPASYVSSLALAPDGTICVAGWDKSVHLYPRGANGHSATPRQVLRVPVGPGLAGAINAVAVSPNNEWIAVAGRGASRDEAGSSEIGLIAPAAAKTNTMREHEGIIRLFSRNGKPASAFVGHRGPVLDLAFEPNPPDGHTPRLASIADDWNPDSKSNQLTVLFWQEGQGKIIEPFRIPDVRPSVRPQIAWLQGERPESLRIAIATGDSMIRVISRDDQGTSTWSVETTGPIRSMVASGPSSVIIAVGDEIQEWSTTFQNAQRKQAFRVPQLGTPVRLAKAGDSIAAVFVDAASNRQWLGTFLYSKWGAAIQRIELTPPTGDAPSLATDGKTIAVAARASHAVDVFSIENGVFRQNNQPQVLIAKGGFPRNAQFATKDAVTGITFSLLTNPNQPPAADKWVYDFAGRTVATSADGWTESLASDPNAVAFRVENDPQAGPRQIVDVNLNNQVTSVRMEPGHRVTATAVRTARAAGRKPILAVALEQRGEPWIELFDLTDGRSIHRLSTHSDRIRSLAFSFDGSRLLSAADDRILAVWDLDDLEASLDLHGSIYAWQFVSDNGVTVGPRLRPGGPDLQAGDRIAAVLFPDGQVQPPDVSSLYHALYARRAGSDATFRVVRDGQTVDVPARLDRAIEDRRPLFSLLVIPGAANEPPSWIGWSPLGTYDASLAADNRIGWLFNAWDNAEHPTELAAGERFKKWFRVGLLQELFAIGSDAAFRAAPRPQPTAAGWLVADDGVERVFDDAPLRVEAPTETLWWTAAGFDDLDRLTAEVRNETTGQVFEPIKSAGGWSLPMSRFGLERGFHHLSVAIRDSTEPDRVASRTVQIQFAPPVPKIQMNVPKEGIVSDQPTFKLITKVDLAGANEGTLELRIRQGDRESTLATEAIKRGSATIEKEVELREGGNFIEAVLKESIDAEPASARWSGAISFRKPKPAAITLESINDKSSEQPIDGRRVVSVAGKNISVVGVVFSETPITNAVCQAGEKEARKLELRAMERPNTFRFSMEDELTPGERKYAFAVESAAGKSIEELSIRFMPRLPSIAFVAPADATELVAGRDAMAIPLELRVDPPNSAKQIIATRNGQRLPVELKEEQGIVRGIVTAEPGSNRFEVTLRDEFGRTVRSQPRLVTLKTPPIIKDAVAKSVSTDGRAELEVTVESAKEITAFSIDGNDMKFRKSNAGTLLVEGVPLRNGDNTISVRVANADGMSLQPRQVSARWTPPRPVDPPKITIFSPTEDEVIPRAETAARISLLAAAGFDRAEIRLNGKEILAELQAGKESNVPLALREGANEIVIRAANSGGESVVRRKFSYVPPPVRIIWKHVVNADGSQVDIANDAIASGSIPVVAAREGRARLVAEARQISSAAGVLKSARVLVNGFKQATPTIKQNPDGVWQINAPIVLTKSSGNQVELSVAGEGIDRANSAIEMTCKEPITDRRLHMLIVGGKGGLQSDRCQKALTFLGAIPGDGKQIRPSSQFTSGVVYGPLEGDVDVNRMLTQMQRIHLAMRRAPNDLAVFCIEGKQRIDGTGKLAVALGRHSAQAGELEGELFSDLLDRTPGAHLVLFESSAESKSETTAPRELTRSRDWWSRAVPASFLRWTTSSVGHSDPLLEQLATLVPVHQSLRKPNDTLEQQFGLPKRVNGGWSLYDSLVTSELLDFPLAKPTSASPEQGGN